MLFLRFFFSPDLFVYLFLWNGKASGYRGFSSFPLFVSLFLCSSCNITLIISTVKRWVLIFCEEFVNFQNLIHYTIKKGANHIIWYDLRLASYWFQLYCSKLTGLYLSHPVVYSGISVRYLFKSISLINPSNVKTGSSRSKQSERNSGKYPCFELQ